jgi:hypothetical protein
MQNRCLEEMGDWASLLEIVERELSDVAARVQPPIEAANVSLLFEIRPEYHWDGPKLLR